MKKIREVKDTELEKVIGGSNQFDQLHMVLTLPVPKKGDLPSPWEKFPGPYKIYK